MSYRNKTYAIFDAGNGKITDEDLCNYRLMMVLISIFMMHTI